MSKLNANSVELGSLTTTQRNALSSVATHDIFHPAKPYASHTLNTTTGHWDPPIPQPELSEEEVAAMSYYRWDEDAYQADNTTGWILETRE